MTISTVPTKTLKDFINGQGYGVAPSAVVAICDELLAVREAQPIGSFHIRDQQVEATTDYVKDGEWPIDNGEILVYSAPPAPEGFNKLNIRAAAQLRAAMRDQWLKAEDFADKIYWQNLHNIANEIVVALMAPTPTK